MRVKIQRPQGVLDLAGSGIVVSHVSIVGDITLTVTFGVARSVMKQVGNVRIGAYTKILPRQDLSGQFSTASGRLAAVASIKEATIDAKVRMKEQSRCLIASQTKKLSSTLVPRRARKDERPQVHRDIESVPNARRAEELALRAVMLRGVDPATPTNFLEFKRDVERNQSDPSSLMTPLLSRIVARASSLPGRTSDVTVTEFERCRITFVMPAGMLIDSSGNAIDQVELVLQLIDDRGVDVATSNVQCDVAAKVAEFQTPKIAPAVAVQRGTVSSKLTLAIKDQMTARVRIVSRTFSRAGNDPTEYTVVDEIQVGNSRDVMLSVPTPYDAAIVYRAIPIGANGRLGARFGSAVIKSPKLIPTVRAAIVAMSSSAGLTIEVRNFPTHARSMQLYKRDLTLHEKNSTSLGTPVHFSEQELLVGISSVVDGDLKRDHIYEYSCSIFTADGSRSASCSCVVSYVPFADGKITTEIRDLDVEQVNDSLDVSFKIESTVADERLDVIKRALTVQGDVDKFASDISTERGDLRGTLVHIVSRVDLGTGERDDMGIIVDGVFRDSKQRGRGAGPITQGHRYRYEVAAAVRVPETLFKSLVKTVTDQTTKKTHSVRPSKHFHPLTLGTGTIVDVDLLSMKHPQDDFAFGLTGHVTSVDVAIDNGSVQVADVSVAFVGDAATRITWRLIGDAELVDHFVITRGLELIGTCHSYFSHGMCEFFDENSDGDVYMVTPVLRDFSLGVSSSSEPSFEGS